MRTLEFDNQLDEFGFVVHVLVFGVVEFARGLGLSGSTRFCFSMSACNSASLLAWRVLVCSEVRQVDSCERVADAVGPCGSWGLSGVREARSSLIVDMEADVAVVSEYSTFK